MKNSLLAILAILFLAFSAFSQTTSLVQGEISIIGVNGSAPKGLEFVTWVDLLINTEIRFTDNGFYSTATSRTPGNVRWQESVLIWKANVPVTAGTVIKIEGETTNIGVADVVNSNGGAATTIAINNNTADQVFAYQGPNMPTTTTAAYAFNATFSNTILAGIGIPTASGAAGSTGWSTGTLTSAVSSYLPSDLDPINTIYLNNSATGGRYTGDRTGSTTPAAYKDLIADLSNWTLSTISNSAVNYDVTPFTLGTLPLTLLSFTGKETGEGISLQWTTANEINTADFTIERAANGADFVMVGTTPSKSANAAYRYTDNNTFAGNSYAYRLKMNDIDGKYAYSPVISVKSTIKTANGYAVYPNPAAGSYLYIKPLKGSGTTVKVAITDLTGRTYHNALLSIENMSNNRFEIPIKEIPAGAYILTISDKTGTPLQAIKFTK